MVEYVTKDPVAIVGLGCVLPDAPDVETFWNNLRQGKNSIREVPRTRWNPDQYWSSDKSVPDKTYAKIGAFIEEDNFNGLEYRMPPKIQQQVDNSQRWGLSATRQALLDAGYATGIRGDEGKEFNRNRCAVILGNAMGGETNKLATKRLFWPEAEAAITADPAFQKLSSDDQAALLQRAEERYKSDTNPITEDTMPGHLSNVLAGRIANVFDLSGKNFTTDAACASSLAAIDAAIDALQSGDCDMVISGGSDRSMDITPYIQFSKIGALSPDGSRPFDKDANGFVMGEGCAIFVLKRLADAERDGDDVYAVIRGIGSSSDGKGKGITAPNPAGQVKAVIRAYKEADVDPATVGYLEAHGTSTPVGDPVELQSVENAFKELTELGDAKIAVGSVKSNIGHLKAAAGAAGMLKAVLAVHHAEIPASINVRELNPRIDWANSPFSVQRETAPWPAQIRRAAVSSFGFGGTNFHVVLEQHRPGELQKLAATTQTHTTGESMPTIDKQAFSQYMEQNAALEAEALVLDGAKAAAIGPTLAGPEQFTKTGEGERIRDRFFGPTSEGLTAATRVGIAVADPTELPKKLQLAAKAAANPAAARLAFNQGVFLNQGQPEGKVAFLFPGQGTQYVNMFRDLAAKYEIVRNTFEEADSVLFDDLGGIKLTDILWPNPDTEEAGKAANEKLKLTEFTQPAVLAADVAILRLLGQWGIKADVVAGHSLGEYGALVAAGVLSFADALHAVAARGREMAHVDVPDLGKMAAVPADWATVQSAIAGIDGYVIPANKNCPSQTVLAGSSAGVDAAVAQLKAQGLEAQLLPVSAAFHSEIVAPASKPLRNVLSRLDVNPPRIECLSNVGAVPYPDDPEAIRDNLAKQVASPVEWIDIIEKMYAQGVRTFIEVGPKRALTGFALDILKDKPDVVAICANHPKKGGIQHVNELFAFLGAWGFRPKQSALQDPTAYTLEFRNPAKQFTTAPASSGRDARLDALEQKLAAIESALQSGTTAKVTPPTPATPVAAATPVVAPASNVEATKLQERIDALGITLDDVAISGISVGLPGKDKPLFAEDNFDRILRGDNMIDSLPDSERTKLAAKNIVRLVKGGDGTAQFQTVSDIAQVIKLAGRRGSFDLKEWGISEDLVASLDRTFQYAIAAGLEALRDAGIPLQQTYLQTSTGSHLPKEWKLPESLRDETGIIFASAFPGYDNLLREVSAHLADKFAGRTLDDLQLLYQELLEVISDDTARNHMTDWFEAEFASLQDALPGHGASRYEFNRKFLFEVLSMGHSQFAQLIGARGPNTQVNAACASTTQAITIAEDWIRTGRCRRVLVIGADDVTSDAMFEWIGSGFLATGAATTKENVEDAALPFDRRRHGMIVGMGAVGVVVEAEPETTSRGMRPIARLLASEVRNSAFHGSRLDVEHIGSIMQDLLAKAARRKASNGEAFDVDAIAGETLFVSHETYTPARGGSASAEIHALRSAFGSNANKVVVANTKGFTGHPQGAGIEDAISLKCLQRGEVPPIANFKEPDPELGDLRLSTGGKYDLKYALRLAAGFGSQVAMTLTELVAREDERVADAGAYQAWLSNVSGLAGADTEVVNRTLRIVDQGPPARAAPVQEVAPQQAPVAASSASTDEVLAKLIAMVAEQTGYPTDMLDPDLDMEADLGIDTVKQAELFGAIREHYNLELDEGVQIKDYPTLRKVAGYFSERLGGSGAAPQASAPAAPSAPSATGAQETGEDVLAKLIAMVAEQTGYPTDMLDPDLDMEADLGIDTVKQAELFGAIREHYNLELDEGVQIKDYPTLRKVAGYFSGRIGGSGAAKVAVAATPTVTPPTVEAAGEDEVLAKLIAMVAEQTGYPTDMLEPDLDMEADLGIDTVKQAELFGAIREHYNLELDEGVQIKDYPTLRKVAGYFAQRLGGSAPVAAPEATPAASVQTESPPAMATPEASTASSASESEVLDKLIAMVAEQTGYPTDMLEPDLDMEADLGIDTVKQAELFGAIREHYNLELDEGVQIKDYPTLRKVAGYFAGRVGQAPAPAQVAAPEPVAEPVSTGTVGRMEPYARPEASPETDNQLERGTIVVLGDPSPEWLRPWRDAGYETSTKFDGVPAGIVAFAIAPVTDPAAATLQLFEQAKHDAAGLVTGKFIAVVTAQDGAHGTAAPHDPGMAAMAGIGKALRKEFPEIVVKVIDTHPECEESPQLVLDEVLSGGIRSEVCFDKSGQRHVIEVAPVNLDEGLPVWSQKGIVVSGGAQGITVEMLLAVADQNPRFLLLGRTEQPEQSGQWATWDDARWKQEEQAIIASMKEAGDKVTPVTVQKRLSPMQKAAEVARNLQRLQDAGAEVLYAPVDVTDAQAVSEAVSWARDQWGQIDGVIHAAGVEISKDITSKDAEQFSMVFGIKQKGWQALMDATKDDALSVLGAFGSVAGRFGNLGQTDYSAANEYLCKAVKVAAVERNVETAFTIAWGPWGEVGMATRGSIMQIMEASGVTPIPTEAGVNAFLAEAATPGIRECVFAGALGAIDVDGQCVATRYDASVETARQVVADNPEYFRLISGIQSFQSGKQIVATVAMDQAVDPAFADHRVDGVPFFPGVFGIESFAEAAGLLVPSDLAFLGATDVQFALPLKQLKDAPATGTITATIVSEEEEAIVEIACELTSQFIGPNGQPVGNPKLHFSGTLRFGVPTSAPEADYPMLAPLRARPDIYPPFFHGPSFQVLDRAGPLGKPSVALFRPPTEAHFGAGDAVFLSHPMIVEAMFQTCGLGVLHGDGVMCLPAGIAALDVYVPGNWDGDIRLCATPTGTDDAGNRTFDVKAIGSDGTLLVALRGFAMIQTGPAPAKAQAPAPSPPATEQATENGKLATNDGSENAEITQTPAIPGAAVELPEEQDMYFAAVTVDEGADCSNETHWFTSKEIEKWSSFKVPKRAAEWRAGRLAAKKAVCETDSNVSPRQVVVQAEAETGRPNLIIDGKPSALWVSITHRDGIAIAAVSPGGVGIDLETVEDRAESFLTESFSENELAIIRGSATPAVDAACMWAAKEAALKRAGIGLNSNLRQHEVLADGHGGAFVSGPEGKFGIRFFDIDGRVLAVSAGHMDPQETVTEEI